MNLTVLIKSATNLIAADSNGKSDPYCAVSLNGDKKTQKKTKKIKKTLNPTWDEKFSYDEKVLSRYTVDQNIHFTVKDWDRFGSDDPLGDGNVPIWQLVINPSQEWVMNLELKGHASGSCGRVVAELTLTGITAAWQQAADKHRASILAAQREALLKSEAEAARKECENMPEDFSANDAQLTVNANTVMKIGLRWDFYQGMPPVDLDIAACCYNNIGSLVDAAFFNQLQALNGAIVHSGDCKDGSTSGNHDDESITIHFARLDPTITVIILNASVYEGGTFANVEAATAHISMNDPPGEQQLYLGGLGNKTSSVLACVFRHTDQSGEKWMLRTIERATDGHTFQECKGMMQVFVDQIVGHEMKAERVMAMDKTFDVKKGETVGIGNLSNVCIGLGWTDIVDDSLDLDASIVMVNGQGQKVGIVYYGKKIAPGIRHMGDNTTGQGAGDDEVIMLNLNEVEAHVQSLFVTINVYSGGSFRDIRDSFMRLFAGSHTLSRYNLENHLTCRGVIFGCIKRTGRTWAFTAMGEPCGGVTAGAIRCSHWH